MPRPLILMDLDDTIFQTKTKCSEEPGDQLTLVSVAANGNHSYMTGRQLAFVEWLLTTGDVVPVTARGLEAYKAVKIPFRNEAIIANGAVILNADGALDLEWAAVMAEDLSGYAEALDDFHQHGVRIAAALDLDVRSWLVVNDGLAAYIVFKENKSPDGHGLKNLSAAFTTPSGWTHHLNGNNLAIIPPPVSKARATEYFINRVRLEESFKPIIGFGDSVADLPFLRLCDWWGTPPRSQISQLISSVFDEERTV